MITVSRSILGYAITAKAEKIGPDWLVMISGGCAHHIGSTSVAWPESGEVRIQSTVLPKHKDHIVGELFAVRLASKLGCCVSASCGIHYDNLSAEEIDAVVACAERLLEDLIGVISAG